MPPPPAPPEGCQRTKAREKKKSKRDGKKMRDRDPIEREYPQSEREFDEPSPPNKARK
jgi:hypothetical protein